MGKPELQFLYASHGKYDSDLQDQMFDDVFPAFLEPGALNIVGKESAGVHTDAQRDMYFRSVQRDSSTFISYAQNVRPEERIEAYRDALFTMLQSREVSSAFIRRDPLLEKWNKEHPNSLVYPWVESFSTEGVRDRISDLHDRFAGAIVIDKTRRWVWTHVAKQLRENMNQFNNFEEERDINWVRILRDLFEMTKSVKAKVKVLVNLGTCHRPLTEKSRAEFGDNLIIHPDIVLPEDSYEDPQVELMAKLRAGLQVSDEEYIRLFLFNSLRYATSNSAVEDPSNCYAENREFFRAMREYVYAMPFQEVLDTFNLGSEEEARRNPGGVGNPISFIPANAIPGHLIPAYSKDSEKSALVDRREHPNNLYLDKLLILNFVCPIFGITSFQDTRIDLLRQMIDRIPNGNVWAMRKEIFDYYQQPDYYEQPLPNLICMFIFLIAKQDPNNPDLWSVPPKGKIKKISIDRPGHRLVKVARQIIGASE